MKRMEENFKEKIVDSGELSSVSMEADVKDIEMKRRDSSSKTFDSQSRVKIKKSLAQAEVPPAMMNDLKEANDVIKRLRESLKDEKKLSVAKDTTIENLRHEIDLLNEEFVDRKKENSKNNSEIRKLRSKKISLETENKILERQVKMANESNKRFHNELHEMRNKLHVQEGKVRELRVQRSEAYRKYAQLLQTSLDKSTRRRYFLQQLQNEIQAHNVTSSKFRMEKEALETLMQEDNTEDKWKSSYALSEGEKTIFQRDLESALVGSKSKVPERSTQVEKITMVIERIVTEALRSRLGKEKQQKVYVSKMIQEAQHHIKSLDKIESSHIETAQRLKDKVEKQLNTLDVDVKDFSKELRLAHNSMKEDEEKIRSIAKASTDNAEVERICLARRALQEEKLDLESDIQIMERRTENSTSEVSSGDMEVLSMKRRMADMLKEKLLLSDKLIESQNNLCNLENLLERRSLESEKREKELNEKEMRIVATEESLLAAQKETLNLKEELETAKKEVGEMIDVETQTDTKTRNRSHRVELNFIPCLQPTLTRKVETLKQELFAVRRNSLPQLSKFIPVNNRGVQVGGEANGVKIFQDERSRAARRRFSVDMTSSGHVKSERRISRTELTLTKRTNKQVHVQIGNHGAFLEESMDHSKGTEELGKKVNTESKEPEATMGEKHEVIKRKEENQQLQENKSEEATFVKDYPPFNQPKRVSELWTAIEETRSEKEQGIKQIKELQNELEKQEEEIQLLIQSVEQPSKEETVNEINAVNYPSVLNSKDNACEDGVLGIQSAPEVSLDDEKQIQEIVTSNTEGKVENEEISDLKSLQEEKRKEDESPTGDVAQNKSNMEDLIVSPQNAQRQNSWNVEETSECKRCVSDVKISAYQSMVKIINSTEDLETCKCKISDLQMSSEDEMSKRGALNENTERSKSELSDVNTSLKKNQKEMNHYAANGTQECKSVIFDAAVSVDNGKAEKTTDEYKSKKLISDLKNREGDMGRCTTQTSYTIEERKEKQGSVEVLKRNESEISHPNSSPIEKKGVKQAVDNNHEDLLVSVNETRKENHIPESENSELRRDNQKLTGVVEGFEIKEAEVKVEKERSLLAYNSQLKLTVDNLKNQILGADKKIQDLKCQAEEDNKTICQLTQEQLKNEQLEEQIYLLETNITEKDSILELKLKEILKRDEQIEKIAQEKENLEKMIQDVLSTKEVNDLAACEEKESEILKAQKYVPDIYVVPNEVYGNVNVEDMRRGLNEFKGQLKTLQVELEAIQSEKQNLEATVQQLRNVKRSQGKELAILRQQIQKFEDGVHDTQRALEKNAGLMIEKEKELRGLVNENVNNTRQIENLETSLRDALQERDSTSAAKDKTNQLLQETNQTLENEVCQLRMDMKEQMSEEDYKALTGKLKETELKYLLTTQEKDKVEKELKNTNERIIALQKDLGHAQALSKGKEDKLKMLTAENIDLKSQIENKNKILRQEEKLRMENMKSLDTLKFKMEKMEMDDKRQRERLFSLKSACTEANEAYKIVKNQNHDLKLEIENVKKKLSEKDCELEATEKEKEEIEVQILNASRTMDDLRKNSSIRIDESVSPDSALGISLTSAAFDFSSGPNSPTSVASDNAFSADSFGEQDTGLLCKMPSMIENFKAVVRENEAMRSKLYDLTVRKEKIEGEMRHLIEVNEMLKSDVAVKGKSVVSLEEKAKMLENELQHAKNKIVSAERSLSVVSSQADLLKSELENRTKEFTELQGKIEMHENKEKSLELHSKSVTEKLEHEASQRKRFEDLSRRLIDESTLHKNTLQIIATKLLSPSVNSDENYSSAQGTVPIATVEEMLDTLLKNKTDLEVLASNLQAELADLQLANGDLQKHLTQYLESEKMRKELKEELQAVIVRDELKSATIVKLEEQKRTLEDQNKSFEEAIKKMTTKLEELEDVELRSNAMKCTIAKLEKSNEISSEEAENLKNDLLRANEENEKLENKLRYFQDKMAEIETTSDAFQVENEKLRTDVIALTQAKCEIEMVVSEAERHNKKLKEAADNERVNLKIIEAQKNDAVTSFEAVRNELERTKNCLTSMEEKQEKADQSVEEMRKENLCATLEKRRLEEELQLAKKDLSEMEERYSNSIQQKENSQRKLNLANVEVAKLMNAQEQSRKQTDALEKNLVQSKLKNEELETALEINHLEKTKVMKHDIEKNQIIQALEAKIKEFQEKQQTLTNDLYVATRKVLTQQQNVETLMNEMGNLPNREIIVSIKNSQGEDKRNVEKETAQRGVDWSEREEVLENLRQSIRTTTRNLDVCRSEAKLPEIDTKDCQRDIEFINKEFLLLRNQLSTFSVSSRVLSEEIKRSKEDLKQKETVLEETKEQNKNVQEENLENRESIIQLQRKCTELESLFGEYESKAEQQHNELVRANQQVSTLDSTLLRTEQKKIVLEKELLVAQEKISNLEACVRAMKDEGRNDKKRIATLETEFNDKQVLAQELKNTESMIRDFKSKLEDALKEKEEAKVEMYGNREELYQQQVELKNARKDVENLKKQVNLEKEMKQKVELDFSENTAICKKYKNNLQELERALERQREHSSELEEKVSIVEMAENTLRKETELQAIEMKRLEEELAQCKEQYATLCKTHETGEKERKKLTNELIAAEEKIAKLHGTCSELLKEKELNSCKVSSLNEALEVIIASNEETADNLKTELLTAKKELSVTNSALDRRQKQLDDLQEELKNDELKIKSLEEKKQELFEKYWASQNLLSDAEGTIQKLRSENKEIKEQNASVSQRIQQLQFTLQAERDNNDNERAVWNDQVYKLKTLHQKATDECGYLKTYLEQVKSSLEKTEDELKQTSEYLTEKERAFEEDITRRDQALDELSLKNCSLKGELMTTKDALTKTSTENDDLKERLGITLEKVERLEKELQERNADVEDLLAEAQAKLKVVQKMKATNSGELLAELPFSEFPEFIAREDEEGTDGVGANHLSTRESSMKHVMTSFHKTCLASFYDNRGLQQQLAAKLEEITRLEDHVHKEGNSMSEVKRHLHDLEKKNAKLENEVKRLRKRLGSLKLKTVEMEKEKDNEMTEIKREKVFLEKDLKNTKEALDVIKEKLKTCEEEKGRHAKELNATRRQIVDVKDDLDERQQQLRALEENCLQFERRTLELEENDLASQKLIHDKENEFSTTKEKLNELQRLYDEANEHKIELYSKLGRVEEQLAKLDSVCREKINKNEVLESQIADLKDDLANKNSNLENTVDDMKNWQEKCEELEIQLGSLQATNEILKQQLATTRKDLMQLKEMLQSEKELSGNLRSQINDLQNENNNLEAELKKALQQKESKTERLMKLEENLNNAEEKAGNSFREMENFKRQMVKVQSDACSDSVRKQLEIGKLRAEAESLRKELHEKDKELSETLSKTKITEKENEFLKKDLAQKHSRESELKLDLTSTNSKLQSYVIERECWEREVKSVLSEMEQEKNVSQSKEEKMKRLRTRYEKEIKFLRDRVEALELEVRVIQEANEQQRRADEISSKLAMESKDIEIDNLKFRLQANATHTSEKNGVMDIMKQRLQERTREITDLIEQIRMLKESYHLELGSLHADLKCAQMENMLCTRGEMNMGLEDSRQEKELLEAIKNSRKESERLRSLLNSKMKEMKSLSNYILSERGSGERKPGY
ncbi:golgin subfamily A member 4-like [Montipora capricornis]|uniref:golgin subfamily A member 4-like n=1 Tax=Montipora capricornis TaxID=246305 RepID=UPI0035F1B272